MGGLKKFRLLLWKNYVLQKRQKVQTVVEILLPLLFTGMLVCIRAAIEADEYGKPVYYPPFDPRDPAGTFVLGGKFILYAPENQHTQKIMKDVRDRFFSVEVLKHANYVVNGFKDEESLLKDYNENLEYIGQDKSEINEKMVLAVVIFTSDLTSDHISYTLRFPASHHGSSLHTGVKPMWFTQLLYPVFQVPGPREKVENETDTLKGSLDKEFREHGGIPGYWRQGFLYLQAAVDDSIVRWKAGPNANRVSSFNISLNRYPYPKHVDDPFLLALQLQLPMMLVLSFIYSTIQISKSIVHEKERRLKESMKMMGLPNWLHWSAWFTKSMIFLVISTILMTILFKIKLAGGRSILTYADPFLLFVFFLCYIFTVTTQAFLVAVFFSTANSASTASGVAFFVAYFPYAFLSPRYVELSKAVILGTSLIGNTAMGFGCQIINQFEGTGAGISWSTIANGASPEDKVSMLEILVMLVVDGFLYLFLAIYIEGIFPGDYGVPLPWYFPFTKWYWCGGGQGTSRDTVIVSPASSRNAHLFEKEPNNRAGIKVMGLRKVFGKKVAVDDLQLNLYENQVTALLGHNGAGKTTTMSMITGLFPPTKGTVLVNGYDIRTEIQSVRASLGLCPQHDVLFDELTVEEHLEFFCLLKGMEKKHVKVEINRMLTSLKLEHKRSAQSHTLSGGMKRKLSVGIALVGGSKVVLLDEPTSGMDPGARRSTWDLISSEKKGRTIVLSTHFMDEADLLGDRIAIMAHGRVICCGSSLFLKKKYGGGYHLIIVKGANCQVNLITQLLQQRIPEVNVDQNIGAELSYSLPEAKSQMFSEMFMELEARRDELGIDSYGCSITQMEEVFMRVGEQVEAEKYGNGHHNSKSNLLDSNSSSCHAINMDGHSELSNSKSTSSFKLNLSNDSNQDRNTGLGLLFQQLRAMLVKKMLHSIRNKLLFTVQTAVPVFFLILALFMLKSRPQRGAPPERKLDLTQYTLFGRAVTAIECSVSDKQICTHYQNVAEQQSTVKNIGNKMLEHYIVEESEKNLPRVNYQHIVSLKATNPSAEEKRTNNQLTAHLTGFFNNQPYHGAPVALNLIYGAILQSVTGNNKIKLSVSNYPTPFTTQDKVTNLLAGAQEGFQVGFNISFGMSFLAASFVVFLIKEREAKSKHLQYVSGAKFPIFWFANWIFDIANYMIPCFALMIVLVAFQTEDFKSGPMQGRFLLVLIMYAWAVIPLMYLMSAYFTVPSSGYVRMMFFNLLTGMATLIAIQIFQIPAMNLQEVGRALEWPFMLIPNFDLGYSIVRLSYNNQLHKLCPILYSHADRSTVCRLNSDFACCKEYPTDYLSCKSPGIGRNIMFLFLVGLFCMLLLMVIESKIIQKLRFGNEGEKYRGGKVDADPNLLEDSDVMKECIRIRKADIRDLVKSENMVLRDLTKYYKSFLAVDGLCLGVQQGECFGLLGINGAGKTTTFKMLTGDIPITMGDAFVAGKSVKSHIKDVQRMIGYCPQFDALIPELTGRETIRLFARLRGVKEPEIDGLADRLAADLLFSEHIDKACGTYSGGNKRKLSVAISLIGGTLIFLDEPTTGMDPVARRHLWNTIIKARESGTSVILTSHSMEECEALCTRLAIMVNGKFRCLGSTQHLKNKFGDGYTLIAQMVQADVENSDDKSFRKSRRSLEFARRRSSASVIGKLEQWEVDLQPLRNFIEHNFPGCQLKDVHPSYVYYHIPANGSVSWSEMFKKMEEAKVLFKLEAYSVGQTSLEQVFLGFAKGQCNDDD